MMPWRSAGVASFLDWLVAPMDAKEFFAQHWERRLLHVSRSDVDYFGRLFTLADLDDVLSTVTFPLEGLDLAMDDEPIAKHLYSEGPSFQMGRVLNLHREGATIILRDLHHRVASLRALRRDAVGDLHAPVQVNLYATPPARKSTPPHWDTHDLFILQIHGAKTWRIFDHDRPLPEGGDRFYEEVWGPGRLREEVPLQPGDVLYLPRGTIHEPLADTYSIHLAVGVHVTRVVDVIEELVRVGARELVGLREALPPPGQEIPEDEVVAKVLAAMELLRDERQVRAVLHGIHQRVGNLDPDTTGWLSALADPDEPDDTWVLRRRAGLAPWREAGRDVEVLRWSTEELAVPTAELATFLVEIDQFSVADLPGLSARKRKELAAALLDGGYARRVQPVTSAGLAVDRWRPADRDDVAWISAAERATAEVSYGRAPTDLEVQRFADLLGGAARDPAQVIQVLERDGARVGYFWLERRSPDAVHLLDLFVEPDQRGTGVADTVLARAREAAAALGASVLTLAVGRPNAPAQRFFHRHGAVPADGSTEAMLALSFPIADP